MGSQVLIRESSLHVYQRFDRYQPRDDGEVSFTAGPKIVHFDRVEWHVLADPASKAAALQTGEMDWWENPVPDLLPLLKQHGISIRVNPTGTAFFLRPNHLYPPFDKPARLPTAFRHYITDVLEGFAKFWNVRRI